MILKDNKRKRRQIMLPRSEIAEICELFRCHFTPNEVMKRTNLTYSLVCELFRGFKYNGIKKYNKLNLSTWEELKNDETQAA